MTFCGITVGLQAGRMAENQTVVLPFFTDLLVSAFLVACCKFRLCHTAGREKSKCLDVNAVTAELFWCCSFGRAVPVPPPCNTPVIVTSQWLWEILEPVNMGFLRSPSLGSILQPEPLKDVRKLAEVRN